jgi:peptidyl-prolyl cis-trans isomerase A (cyclophilin A)
LATGERSWVDEATGLIRSNAFYNGLTFHRVITNFMIQGGSPNGLGNDGPGYVFTDEFTPLLRFDRAGVLAMANSGPNSSGSQFFITVTNYPSLNDVHTIFGQVTSGQSVVNAIDGVATGANDRPLTNVVLHSVTIRRVGTAAQSFDIHTQGLPVILQTPVALGLGTSNLTVSFTNVLHSNARFCSSSNLVFWTHADLGFETVSSARTDLTFAPSAPAAFFSITAVQYPSATFAPRTVRNRILTLTFTGGTPAITIQFDGANGGSYLYWSGAGNPTMGTVVGYTWGQEAYRGRLSPIIYSTLVPMSLRLDFTNATSGTFAGTIHANPSFGASGVFSFAAP